MGQRRPVVISPGLYRSFGGPNKSVPAFAKALDARIMVWGYDSVGQNEPLVVSNAITIRPSRIPILSALQVPAVGQRSIAEQAMSQASFVTCHLFWRWHNAWLLNQHRRFGTKYLFVPHGGLDPFVLNNGNVLVKRIFLSYVGRRFFDGASGILFSSRREMHKALPLIGRRPCGRVLWPLDEKDFRVKDLPRGGLVRERLGIPDGDVVFLYLGRLHSMKRPLETIESFARAHVPNAHLIVVGNHGDVTVRDCTARASKLGVSGNVHCVGEAFGEARDAYLDASDVFVSLSWRENFGMSAAECLASGLPVMLSPGNDLAWEVSEFPFCRKLNTDNLDEAAAAIRSIVEIGRPGLAKLGEAASRWSESELRFEVFQSRLGAFLKSVGLSED